MLSVKFARSFVFADVFHVCIAEEIRPRVLVMTTNLLAEIIRMRLGRPVPSVRRYTPCLGRYIEMRLTQWGI